MKKLISTTDWLLLGLARSIDFLRETKDALYLYHQYYQVFYGYNPGQFKKTNLYHLLWRNLKTGNIAKKVVNGQVCFELTAAGKKHIKRHYPILNLKDKPWDRVWRLAIFDIEEENKHVRDMFRSKLKELGFACLQKSVWISPYDFLGDFKEFLETHQLQDRVILLETKNLYIEDIQKLASRLWSLDKINDYYKELDIELMKLTSLTKTSDRVILLKTLREKIIHIYLKDPHLPSEFLPDDWVGDRVKDLVKKQRIF